MDDSLRARQDIVIEFLKLGMDFDSACSAAEVSPEAKQLFIEDEDFQRRKRFALSQVEAVLLKRLETASLAASGKGDIRATERLLGLIKPERYAPSTKISVSKDNAPNGISISFVESAPSCEEEDPPFVLDADDED